MAISVKDSVKRHTICYIFNRLRITLISKDHGKGIARDR